VDDAILAGNEITPFYDPMIAKLIVWGEDRSEALRRAENALQQYAIEGIKTNLPLHLEILQDERFKQGQYTTNFLYDRK
jgi:acetyl-CoA carboxylase biotin carboxylase subunit